MDETEPTPSTAAPPNIAAETSEILEIVHRTREGRGDAEELQKLSSTEESLAGKDLRQDIGLKRTYAIGLIWLLAAQLLIADVVFIIYAAAGVHWKLSASVIDVWLGATLVEVIGIVLVVTRYLFPSRDQ